MKIRKVGKEKAEAILRILQALKKGDATILELTAASNALESAVRTYVRTLISVGAVINLNPGRGVVTVYRYANNADSAIAEERMLTLTRATVMTNGQTGGVHVENYLITGHYAGEDNQRYEATRELHALFFARPPSANFISLGDDYANPKAAVLQDHQRT